MLGSPLELGIGGHSSSWPEGPQERTEQYFLRPVRANLAGYPSVSARSPGGEGCQRKRGRGGPKRETGDPSTRLCPFPPQRSLPFAGKWFLFPGAPQGAEGWGESSAGPWVQGWGGGVPGPRRGACPGIPFLLAPPLPAPTQSLKPSILRWGSGSSYKGPGQDESLSSISSGGGGRCFTLFP